MKSLQSRHFICAGLLTGALSSVSSGEPTVAYSSLKSFGAVCDGRRDDTLAINLWLKSAAPHRQLVAPAGVCNFSAALTTPQGGLSEVSIQGAGAYQTVFRYVGANRSIDLLTIGDGVNQYKNWQLQNFRVTSNVKMTQGAGIHLRMLMRSMLANVVLDGQDGNGDLWNGIWFDGVDFVTWDAGQSSAQSDGVRVSGDASHGQADLFFSHLKIAPADGTNMKIGIHIGGGFGGFICDGSDIIGSDINLLVDNALASQPNREINIGPNCALDSATDSNAVINDSLANGGNLFFSGWNASARHFGYSIKAFRRGNVSFSGNTIYNNGADGVSFLDTTVNASFSANVQVYGNGRLGGGYGLNAVQTLMLRSPLPSLYDNANGSVKNVLPDTSALESR